jgi:antitoxin YefM
MGHTLTYRILYVKVGNGRGYLMKTMSYTESRACYAEVLDSVVNDREEVVITRAGHEPVVIVSLDDYQAMKETAYLSRSPENERRILKAIKRLEKGEGQVHNLEELLDQE